ncbi:hypothetical protein JK386_09310 [Nocardioides sp. zg-536]|uniref:Uncharacterized protein n=1 Tax=Nocardioides faecalis TaxID=2803858 RepID=A0A938Y9U9_9ACTN|nr:DUF6263 family protein [Nocardioides faecalis]MBM9460101.1 hypothetical protein [Nocardioides faecalis]QVI60105.1 hypothetical protein KG111_07305 [Nocardioides faecalis]
MTRSRTLAAAAVASLALAALSACTDEPTEIQGVERSADAAGPSATPSTASPSASPPAAPSSPAAGAAAPVELLSAGAAPRRAVVLDVEVGHTESSTLRIDTEVELAMLSSGPIEVSVRLPYTSKVTAVSADRIDVEVRYGRGTVDVPVLRQLLGDQLDDTLAALQGTTAQVAYTPAGGVISSDVDLGAAIPPMLDGLLDGLGAQSLALAVPFPVEAVGVGARWRTTSEVDLGGVIATAETTYELRELDADGYTVAVTATQTADEVQTPLGMLSSLSGTTTGTLTGRTGLLAPASTRAKGELGAQVGAGAQGGTTSDSTVTVEVRGTTR